LFERVEVFTAVFIQKIVETTEIKVILRLKIISEKIENYEEKVWYFY
jgi:hypothetical protein